MSSSRNANVADTIRAVARGEREFGELRHFGITISRYDDLWEIDNPDRAFSEVSAQDIAHGLARWKNDPSKLQLWASFILSSSSLIGIESLQNEHHKLLDALWDAAFESRISDETQSCIDTIFSQNDANE